MSDQSPDPSQVPRSGYLGASTASLRSEIRLLRVLVYVCIALLIVLLIGAGLALASISTQIDTLQRTANAARTAPALTAAEGQAPESHAEPAPSATRAGLGPVTPLAGVDLPDGADPAGAIVVGDPNATTVVETYIDFQCPYCQQWERQFGTALIDRALQPNSGIQVKQYNMAFLGETSATLDPPGASARAASAAACVVDRDGAATFAAFSRAVFASADPREPAGQFTDAVLSDIARAVGASADAISCIQAEEFVPFAAATTQGAFTRGVTGTPTVLIDGVVVANAFADPRVAELTSSS